LYLPDQRASRIAFAGVSYMVRKATDPTKHPLCVPQGGWQAVHMRYRSRTSASNSLDIPKISHETYATG